MVALISKSDIDHYDYKEINERSDKDPEHRCYTSLWGAVILQALVDATTDYKRTEYRIEKKKSTEWLLEATSDFISVCQMASMSPKYVRDKAKEIIMEGRQCRPSLNRKKRQKSDSYGI